MKTFEEYLKDAYASFYTGTDDDITDNFEAFLERLDVDKLLEYATVYGSLEFLKGKKAGLDKAEEIFTQKII
jgi:hypothetical protein